MHAVNLNFLLFSSDQSPEFTPRTLIASFILLPNFILQYSRGEKFSRQIFPQNKFRYLSDHTRSRRNSFSICCRPYGLRSNLIGKNLSPVYTLKTRSKASHQTTCTRKYGLAQMELRRQRVLQKCWPIVFSFFVFLLRVYIYTSQHTSSKRTYTMLNRSTGFVSAVIRGAADGSLANRWFIFLRFF